MAKILEHHGKQLMKKMGIAVPEGRACKNIEEVMEAAREYGGKVMIKALVPVGGRGKVGAVKKAFGAQEAAEIAASLIGSKVKEYPCEEVLVEKCLEATRELYIAITFDSLTRGPMVMVSATGGVDIEEMFKNDPASIKKFYVHILQGLREYQARQLWEELGLESELIRSAADMLVRLYKVFRCYDLRLIEVNPVIQTAEGKFYAADVVLTVDDEALFRQPDLKDIARYGQEMAWRPPTLLEQQMIEADQLDPYRGTSRFLEFDSGDIGFMCGGGGGSLVMMDTLIKYGGKPKNYTEMGGNPTERKLVALARTVLSQPGLKGFIRAGNISSNTQVDLVAKAVVQAVRELGIDPKRFPMVVRATGLNDEEARKIFDEAGISYFGEEYTMVQAAKKLIELVNQQEGERAQGEHTG
ncbi:MAG: ATP-grasp domain-containing protein [Bacillota bacterium]